MIPAPFEYVRPSTVDEAVRALADEDAKALAGGQSLIPLLRLRLAAPTLLVDLGGIADLRGIRDDGDALVIGAMTTHASVLANPLVDRHVPLLAQATATVADRQVRHVGTLGGSLAHADPAGDLPAVALALDATLTIAGAAGTREVPASELFVDYLPTALPADEVLVSVRAAAVESALTGAPVDRAAVATAAAHAAEGTNPSADLSASADFRRHLARVLTERAVLSALGGGRHAHAA